MTSSGYGGWRRPLRSARRMLIAIVALALLVVAVLLLGHWGPFTEPPPAGVSRDEWAWCTDRTNHSGPGYVQEVGAAFLGWPETGMEHDGVTGAEVAAPPDAGIACRVAYELSGLTPDEWGWCQAHLPTDVAQAVAMLGLGKGPSDGRVWPPWDSFEQVQACRFAYHYGRDQALPVIDDPASHPFFALSADQQAWCSAVENRPLLDSIARYVRVVTYPDASPIAQRMAYVRTCRVGFILRSSSPVPS